MRVGTIVNISDIWTPTVDIRAVQSTPLVPQGISAVLGAGESHTYEVPSDQRDETLALSICSYHGNSSTLFLGINGTEFYTNQGLAGISSMSDYTSNGTITVTAPINVVEGSTWTYQLGTGGSGSYYVAGDNTYLVDTDFANALLVTSPLQQIADSLMNTYDAANANDAFNLLENATTALNTTNFTLGVFHLNSVAANLSRSYCAIQSNSLLNQNNADLSTTTRGKVPLLRSQFFVKCLNRSEEYQTVLGFPNPERGYLGGTVFQPLDFTTKNSTSCQVIYNMSFCDSMAFAVPGNASSYTAEQLSAFYDDMAQQRYQNFSYSLQQINCNTSAEEMFSPLKTCADCDSSYRDWLCTVTIPRCADMTNNASYLVTREPGESRNPVIDEIIKPGPYKEVLPCKELCYSLVRDCPTSFGFGCPTGTLMDMTYGDYTDDGDVTCSYPGAVYNENKAMLLCPSWLLLVALLVLYC